MDLIKNKPLFSFSIFSIGALSILSGVAVARLNAWNYALAQEEATAADSSFACEPLVFNLDPTAAVGSDEVTAASPTATGTARASATATPRASASPTSTASAQGGLSPTATAKPSATATSTAKATATARPSATSTATTTKGGQLPDAGISTPTIIGIAAGFLLLLAAALLAL